MTPRESMNQKISSMKIAQATMMLPMTVTSKNSMKKPTIWINQYPNVSVNPKNTG